MYISVEHTWVSLVCGLDQRAAWWMIVLGDCSSDPALSGVRGLNSELKPDTDSLSLSPYSQIIYKHTNTHSTSEIISDWIILKTSEIPTTLPEINRFTPERKSRGGGVGLGGVGGEFCQENIITNQSPCVCSPVPVCHWRYPGGILSFSLRGNFRCCSVLLFSNKVHSAAQVLASSLHHNLDNTSFRKLGLNLLSTDEGLDEAALTQALIHPPQRLGVSWLQKQGT